MSTKRTNRDFTQLAHAFGLQPFEAAERVMNELRLGRKPPRWVRRAARAITRGATATNA